MKKAVWPLAGALFLGISCGTGFAAGEANVSSMSTGVTTHPANRADDDHPSRDKTAKPIQFLPLPVYATLPNEGPTYGFMPVFLDADPATAQIKSILAPSLTWNGVSHVTATGRYFEYPNEFEEHIFQATYATRLFREAIADWNVQPTRGGNLTYEFLFSHRVDPYRRFFGIGYDSPRDGETTYTLETTKFSAKGGYNFTDHINASISIGGSFNAPRDAGVEGLPSTFAAYPQVDGLKGSDSYYSLLGIRYETRPIREYSTSGFLVEAMGGGALDKAAKSGAYGNTKLEMKALWDETSWAYGAARAYWGYTAGAAIPWYQRQSLGGSFLLRGFTLDRFVDNGAWAIDFEQRITPYIFHVAGSTVHFRIDPFIAVGQVFEHSAEMLKRVQITEGIGLRAFAPPNVIGRIDIARNVDEVNVYVELGYPF